VAKLHRLRRDRSNVEDVRSHKTARRGESKANTSPRLISFHKITDGAVPADRADAKRSIKANRRPVTGGPERIVTAFAKSVNKFARHCNGKMGIKQTLVNIIDHVDFATAKIKSATDLD